MPEPGPIPGIGAAGAAWTADGCAADGDCVVVVGADCVALVCAKALAATSVNPKPAISERAEVYVMA